MKLLLSSAFWEGVHEKESSEAQCHIVSVPLQVVEELVESVRPNPAAHLLQPRSLSQLLTSFDGADGDLASFGRLCATRLHCFRSVLQFGSAAQSLLMTCAGLGIPSVMRRQVWEELLLLPRFAEFNYNRLKILEYKPHPCDRQLKVCLMKRIEMTLL